MGGREGTPFQATTSRLHAGEGAIRHDSMRPHTRGVDTPHVLFAVAAAARMRPAALKRLIGGFRGSMLRAKPAAWLVLWVLSRQQSRRSIVHVALR